MKPEDMQHLSECAKNVSNDLDADLLLLNGEMAEVCIDNAISTLRNKSSKRDNVALILTTYGGDPDAAYRLARFLQNSYEKFTLIVFGYCKSAGTLVALGADEIVLSTFAELGPLDIQLQREDEMTSTSGLSYYQALLMLQSQSFQMWESHFWEIKNRSQGGISTKTAADISTALTVGILAPIAAQIDPLRLGEVGRASAIALEYGQRLCKSKNAVVELVTGYPSHGFVIDFKEAQSLFDNVREPNEMEIALEQALLEVVRRPADRNIIKCLYPITEEDEEQGDINDKQNKPDESHESEASQDDGGNSEGTQQDIYADTPSSVEAEPERPEGDKHEES